MPTAEECSKSELELFATPPYNVSMERGDYVIHKPLAQITHLTPLEFHVQASPDEYVDLGRMKLQLTLRIAKRSGGRLAQDAKVTTANLLLHTLFSRVDCKLNGMLVTTNVDTYPYKPTWRQSCPTGVPARRVDYKLNCTKRTTLTTTTTIPRLEVLNPG